MRVFFDTNVLVSAFATRGLCADLMRAVLAHHELATCEVVLEELQDVLLRRFRLTNAAVRDIIAFLRRHLVEPTPQSPPPVDVRDPDDAPVLASALAAQADILVTGDKDLLCLSGQVDIAIVDPRGLWNMLKTE